MRKLFGLALGLLVAGAAGAKEINTTGNAHVQNPVWSPDGSWLAYEMNNLSNSVELWLVRIDGGMATQPRQLRIPGASRSFGGGGCPT